MLVNSVVLPLLHFLLLLYRLVRVISTAIHKLPEQSLNWDKSRILRRWEKKVYSRICNI